MQLEATGKSIRCRLRSGEEILLRPGVPTELPDRAAAELLKKAPNRVRVVEVVPASDSIVEPASCRPVYFETEPGVIHGPAVVSLMARTVSPDKTSSFWMCVKWQNSYRWLHESLLRSRRDYDQQYQQTCNTCGGAAFWQSTHDVTVCSRCHPPADARLVREWLEEPNAS